MAVKPNATPEFRYAGFWLRFIAMLLDSVVIFLAGIIVVVAVLGYAAVMDIETPEFAGAMTAEGMNLLWIACTWLYFAGMESSGKQATLGKLALGLQVCDTDGNRISFLRASGRHFSKILSSVILFIGFLMAAFTARKQALHDIAAGCLVLKTKDSHFFKLLVIFIVACALLFGGIGSYLYYVVWPQAKQELTTAIGDPGTFSIEPEIITEEETVTASPAAVSLDAAAYDELLSTTFAKADYDKLFSRTGSIFDKGPTVQAGPAVLELSTIFMGSAWIKVYLPPIPNLDSNLAGGTILIDKVLDRSGQDYFDPGHSFETEFFQRIGLSAQSNPVQHLTGQRTIHFRSGITKTSLQSVHGRLVLRLPVGVTAVSFKPAELNQAREAGTAKVMLKSVVENQVTVHYTGLSRNYLGTKAYNSADQELKSKSRTLPPKQDTIDMDFLNTYEGTPVRVEVLTAQEIIQREYPFILAQ